MLQRDCGDILDRLSIAQLKSERIKSAESHKEFLAFTETFISIKAKFPTIEWGQLYTMMLEINKSIWALEASMKSGKELLPNPTYLDDPKNIDTLASIGKNAILIRNINGLRVNLKNFINATVHEGFLDKKSNHMSE